jgi:hypothetical protein
MTTRKIDTKAIAASSASYIGKRGEIFFDDTTQTLRISDGSTAGGLAVHTGDSATATWPVDNTNGDNGPVTIAIGYQAGQTSQGSYAVAIGPNAGQTSQGGNATAVGSAAGYTGQATQATALGLHAGWSNQGASAVAIGAFAGDSSQHANSIILNATGSSLNSGGTSRFYVAPVRNVTSSNAWTNPTHTLPTGFYFMAYNPTTNEIIYWS